MEARLCTICDKPMIEGQAFNGLRGAHWDCANTSPIDSLFSRQRASLRLASADPVKVRQEVQVDRPAPRQAERGPKSADVRKSDMDSAARQVERRPWAETTRHSENGRTWIGLECPFCYAIVKAYVWSLPNGKRCECGAFHGRLHSTHWREAAPVTCNAQGMK